MIDLTKEERSLNTKGEGQQSGEDFWVSATRSQAVKSLRTVLVY